MIHYLRKAYDRGVTDIGWLNSRHSFSFANYYEPAHMGFSVLKVINDDQVNPGHGFEAHSHHDMEIISYVTHGTMIHKDSLGQQYTLKAGDIQCMSAGTGVIHSEYNGSDTEPLHFLQIWIEPNIQGVNPSYQQKTVEQQQTLTPLVTPTGINHSLIIHQQASVNRLELQLNDTFTLETGINAGYLHMLEGTVSCSIDELGPGDGVGVRSDQLTVQAKTDKVVALWFTLP